MHNNAYFQVCKQWSDVIVAFSFSPEKGGNKTIFRLQISKPTQIDNTTGEKETKNKNKKRRRRRRILYEIHCQDSWK